MPTPTELNALLVAHLRPGDTFRLKVNGSSMRPLLQPGDWVIAQAETGSDFWLGDVLVYRRAGEFVTHRLVGRKAGGLLLKGDALWVFDALVPPQAVLGRVVALEHANRVRALAARRWTSRLLAGWSRCSGELYRLLFFWRIKKE